MPYHVLVFAPNVNDDPLFDFYLGSAVTIEFYWESIGRELDLPMISSLTEWADSEKGFSISSSDLILFRSELEIFEKFWEEKSLTTDLPDGFQQKVGDVVSATNNAISNGLIFVIA